MGSYARPSHYGTFDQGGNVFEWNDTIVSSINRGLRGGSFFANDGSGNGFRVSSLAAIPGK